MDSGSSWDATPSWRGLPLILYDHGARAADRLRLSSWDLALLLESSEPCPGARRAEGIEERCTQGKGMRLKVILASAATGWTENAEAWIAINIKPLGKWWS